MMSRRADDVEVAASAKPAKAPRVGHRTSPGTSKPASPEPVQHDVMLHSDTDGSGQGATGNVTREEIVRLFGGALKVR